MVVCSDSVDGLPRKVGLGTFSWSWLLNCDRAISEIKFYLTQRNIYKINVHYFECWVAKQRLNQNNPLVMVSLGIIYQMTKLYAIILKHVTNSSLV